MRSTRCSWRVQGRLDGDRAPRPSSSRDDPKRPSERHTVRGVPTMSVTALPNQADSEAIVASFRALPCADVADGLLRLGLVGIVQGIAPLDPRWTVCGRAVTVRHVPLQDRSLWSGDATNLAKLLPLCQPEDIVVV